MVRSGALPRLFTELGFNLSRAGGLQVLKHENEIVFILPEGLKIRGEFACQLCASHLVGDPSAPNRSRPPRLAGVNGEDSLSS